MAKASEATFSQVHLPASKMLRCRVVCLTTSRGYRYKSWNPGHSMIGDPGKMYEGGSVLALRTKDKGEVKLPELSFPLSLWPRKISVPGNWIKMFLDC